MKAAVIGGGTWGSAFALHLGQKNIQTRLWIREKDAIGCPPALPACHPCHSAG